MLMFRFWKSVGYDANMTEPISAASYAANVC